MRALRRDLEEVGHEFLVLADINAAEARDTPAAMRVNVEDRVPVLHRPFERPPDGLAPHHRADRAIVDDALILASQAVAVWTTQGLAAAMNRFNGPTITSG